jgi:cell division protein FtsB
MIDLERLETITLTNEELQTEVKRLTAHIGNLQVQISEYRQIVAELSRKFTDSADKK